MSPYTYDHPRPSLTVDVVTFTLRENRLQVLLIQRGEAPFSGMWALPGGFVRMEGIPGGCRAARAGRGNRSEGGLPRTTLLIRRSARDPRGRVVTVAYFALIPTDAPVRLEGTGEVTQARWFPVDELPSLAFDHNTIVTYALRRLRYKLEYTAVGFELLPDEFTLSSLQYTYELILGEKLDKRNFRRRILEANVIEPTPHQRVGEGRPARLYRYRPDAVAEVKARRLFP